MATIVKTLQDDGSFTTLLRAVESLKQMMKSWTKGSVNRT